MCSDQLHTIFSFTIKLSNQSIQSSCNPNLKRIVSNFIFVCRCPNQRLEKGNFKANLSLIKLIRLIKVGRTTGGEICF